ncbi:MAG TPA: high-potential iron-sulfur protein [Candidatus Baltobacteraceae bacterium]|nr:high-potential iron-sulfur protein [Candidatus Baltobacteraceae bacterium]
MKDLTRRELLSSLIGLPALAGLAVATGAVAEAKGSKAQFQYQNHPNGSQACMGCSYFVAGKTATAPGTCRVVAGPISPHGWCTAYAAKG